MQHNCRAKRFIRQLNKDLLQKLEICGRSVFVLSGVVQEHKCGKASVLGIAKQTQLQKLGHRRDTVPCNPVHQAKHLSVGRARSSATLFHCPVQKPVDHFVHIPYTGLEFWVYASQNNANTAVWLPFRKH